MSDASKDLEIMIRTTADTRALDAVARSTRDLATSAPDLNKLAAGYELVGGRLKEVEVAASEAGEGVRGVGKDVEKSAVNMRGMGVAIGHVSRMLTGLTGLGRAAFNPIVLAILVTAEVIEKVVSWFNKLNAQIVQLTKTFKDSGLVDAINARKEAFERGGMELAKYADKMANLHDPEAAFERQIRAQIELLKVRNEGAGEIAKALKGVEEANLHRSQVLQEQELKRQMEAGVINYAQFTQAKLRMDADYFVRFAQLEVKAEGDKLAREKALRDAILAKETESLNRAKGAQSGLDAEAVSKQMAATNAEATAKKDEAWRKYLQGKHPDIAQELANAQAALAEAQKNVDRLNTDQNSPGYKVDPSLIAKVNNLQAEKARLALLDRNLPAEEIAAMVAAQDADRAKSRAAGNATRVDNEDASLQSRKDIAEAQDVAAATAGQMNKATIGTKTRTELDQLGPDAGGRMIDLSGANAQIKAEREQYNAHFKAYQELIIGDLKQNKLEIAKAAAELRAELSKIQSLVKGSYNP